MLTNTISLYQKVSQIKSDDEIPLDLFFDGIRDGKWQDEVLKVRALKDKGEKLDAKKKVTSVTISGKFEERYDDKIIRHSGYIGIDIDSVDDVNAVKDILRQDPYVVAAFMSIGGWGVCAVFKINADKHKESFKGICEYLFTTYNLICDSTSINPSRARFVSFDPDIYINEKATRFTQYLKEKPIEQPRFVYTGDDFSYILKQIVDRSIDITQGLYHNWLRIGFGIADKFGEGGRDYFHTISQFNPKYNPRICNKQFDSCLKAHGASKKTTISTFYWYCKQAGVDIYTPTTKVIIKAATSGKRAGLSYGQIKENLKKFEDIDTTEDVLQEAKDVKLDEGTLLEEIEDWMRQLYDLRRNEVTLFIENKGKPMKQTDLNSIWIKAKKVFDKVPYDTLDRLINSDFVPNYNPFFEFIHKYEDRDIGSGGHIDKLFSSIDTKDRDWLLYFAKKWTVGIISSIHGVHSRLLAALSGNSQYIGKTEFWRRFLPAELKKYYAESKLDRGKDDEILMCQKLLIMDDEMSGKSKKETKLLKDLTSKEIFTLREPYGRHNVDLVRLAVLCATTNEDEILSDWSGNSRIITMLVNSIDFDVCNSVDRINVFMEAYHLYKQGFAWGLNKDDIKLLGIDESYFEVSNLEKELVNKYFAPGDTEWLTASEIKVYIDSKTNQKLALDRVSKELKRAGFTQKHVRSGFTTRRCYGVKYLMSVGGTIEVPPPMDEPPF